MKFKPTVTAILGIVFIISALYAGAYQHEEISKIRSDIIVIDSMKVFGDLERPGVSFPHDKHTDALEKQGKDCKTCHQSNADGLILKFNRTEDIDQPTTLNVYHTDCITCHEDRADEGMETGPVECGECHQLEPDTIAAQQAIEFDASLHHRHIEAADNKCESCHHGYDPDKKVIAYEKGKEDSCRTCHKEETVKDVISLRLASHQQCIGCHLETKDKIESNVVKANKCAGCHEEAQLKQIAKLDSIPRLDRNQPDTTFIKSLDNIGKQMIDAVIFNHQRHEENGDSCSTCHHETLNACDSCHTLSGSAEGNWVTLAQAMHNTGSDRSCVGCHDEKQQAKECVGCHSLTEPKQHVSAGQSCQTCHSVSIDKLRTDKAAGKELMAKHYQTAPVKDTKIDFEALPSEVIIDVISKEYKGVNFPHRHIVESLMEKMEGNILANNFHQGKDVVCQSCHHNSPDVTSPPPSCISCHASSGVEQDGQVPGTKAAYHRQCFECHEKMEINDPVSTDCTACHEEK